MARFYFPSIESANEAYWRLQEMAWELLSDDPISLVDPFPISPTVFDRFTDEPDFFSNDQLKEWSRQINAETTPLDRGWNNFMGNIARFGTVYETLMMYDQTDGEFDGKIDHAGNIGPFSFNTEEGKRPANLNNETILGRGVASFYAENFTGKPTASGLPYDTSQFTVAHKTLPFGTMVKISRVGDYNPAMECWPYEVIAQVNDRGPYAEDSPGIPRVLDLSPSVFEALGGNAANGVMEVVYEVIPFSANAVYASATPPAAGQNQPHFPALYAPWNSFLRRLRLL